MLQARKFEVAAHYPDSIGCTSTSAFVRPAIFSVSVSARFLVKYGLMQLFVKTIWLYVIYWYRKMLEIKLK